MFDQQKDNKESKCTMLHVCEICLKEFPKKYLLILHKRSHSDINKCFYCNQNFEVADKFSEHLNTHILQRKVTQFQCRICQQIFKNNNDFLLHFEDHLNQPETMKSGQDATISESINYICKICDSHFLRLDLCKQHLSKHVSDLICDLCGKCFTKHEHLLNHTRANTKELPFHCTLCTKSYGKKEHLTRHIRTHSKETSFKCEICEKSFSRKDNLTRHSRIHSTSSTCTFECTVCRMQFDSKLKLSSHMRSHTESRPFECGQCNKFFVTAGNLKFHEKTHCSQNVIELKIEAV